MRTIDSSTRLWCYLTYYLIDSNFDCTFNTVRCLFAYLVETCSYAVEFLIFFSKINFYFLLRFLLSKIIFTRYVLITHNTLHWRENIILYYGWESIKLEKLYSLMADEAFFLLSTSFSFVRISNRRIDEWLKIDYIFNTFDSNKSCCTYTIIEEITNRFVVMRLKYMKNVLFISFNLYIPYGWGIATNLLYIQTNLQNLELNKHKIYIQSKLLHALTTTRCR